MDLSLISILLAVIVICFAVWAVQRLTAAFNVGEPIRTVILVVVVLLVLLWALGVLRMA